MRSRRLFRSMSQKVPSSCSMVGVQRKRLSTPFATSLLPPVKREKHFRDPSTGFHTNDAESENNRLKQWFRTRYGELQLNASEMDEYVFYVNVGSSKCDVFHGLAMANGGACSHRLLAIE